MTSTIPPEPVRMDMQVHSTFSDGADTVKANVRAAEAAGLVAMTCVDHVRETTDWLGEYVLEILAQRTTTNVSLTIGIEAKLLDTTGRLDMPAHLPDGIEVIYAADHQVAMPGGVQHPDSVRAALDDRELSPDEVFEALITSTRECLADAPRPVVIAHFLSILPKLGLDQADAPLDQIETLAEECARTGQRIEVNERYRTPTARTLRPFIDRGVELLVSTDSHRADTIGRYDHCLQVLRELSAGT